MADTSQKYPSYEGMQAEFYRSEIKLTDYLYSIYRGRYFILGAIIISISLAVVYNKFAAKAYSAKTQIVIPPKKNSSLLTSTDINLPGNYWRDEKDFNTQAQKIKSTLIARRALVLLIKMGYFSDLPKDSLIYKASIGIDLPIATKLNGKTLTPEPPSTVSGKTTEKELSTAERLINSMKVPLSATEAASEEDILGFDADSSKKNIPSLSNNIDDEPLTIEESKLVSMIFASIAVNKVKSSNVVEIIATNTDPRLARDISITVAEAFSLYSVEYNYQVDSESLRYLTDKIDEVRRQLLSAELDLNDYQAQHKILGGDLDKQLFVSTRTELDLSVIRLRNQRIDMESRIDELKRILNNPVDDIVIPESSIVPESSRGILEAIRLKLVDAQLRLEQIANTLTTNSSDYQMAQNQIILINKEMRQEIGKIIRGLKFGIEVIKKNEQELLSTIKAIDEAVNAKQKQSIKHLVLQRDAESYKWLYQYLLGSVLVAEINTKSMIQGSVEIFGFAEIPLNPIKPKKILNLLIGLLAGLLGGIGITLIVESMDRSINKPEEVEEYSKLPLLSILPHLPPESALDKHLLIVEERPQDAFSEGISRLWSNLRVYVEFKGLNSIIVTSAVAEEGKSIISANLASFAGNNLRLILLDCDLRKPSQHNFFDVEEKRSGGLNKAIEFLQTNPSQFEPGTLKFADFHALVKSLKLSGVLSVSDIAKDAKALEFDYHKGNVIGANYETWRQNHPPTPLEAFLQEADAAFVETFVGPINTKKSDDGSGVEISAEFLNLLDSIPAYYLLSKIENEFAIKRENRNVYVLDSVRIKVNPNEYIGAPPMRELIRLLKLNFDLLIIDTPPAMPFADINAFSGSVNNILLVVRSGTVTRDAIVRTINWFKQINFNLVGYVFNDTKPSRENYYYYGYYSYRQYRKSKYKYYGDEYSSKG